MDSVGSKSIVLDLEDRVYAYDNFNCLAETSTGLNIFAELDSKDLQYQLFVTHDLHPGHLTQDYRSKLCKAAVDVVHDSGIVLGGKFGGPINPTYVRDFETPIFGGKFLLLPGSTVHDLVTAIADVLYDIVPEVVGFDKKELN